MEPQRSEDPPNAGQGTLGKRSHQLVGQRPPHSRRDRDDLEQPTSVPDERSAWGSTLRVGMNSQQVVTSRGSRECVKWHGDRGGLIRTDKQGHPG